MLTNQNTDRTFEDLTQEVLALHSLIFQYTPGFHFENDRHAIGNVSAVLGRVFSMVDYELKQNCDPHAEAAIFLYCFARGHAFPDGNKRIALLMALMHLKAAGIRLHTSSIVQDKLVEVVLDTASGDMDLEELTYWLSRLFPISHCPIDKRPGARSDIW